MIEEEMVVRGALDIPSGLGMSAQSFVF